jgi:hypothetical protein
MGAARPAVDADATGRTVSRQPATKAMTTAAAASGFATRGPAGSSIAPRHAQSTTHTAATPHSSCRDDTACSGRDDGDTTAGAAIAFD